MIQQLSRISLTAFTGLLLFTCGGPEPATDATVTADTLTAETFGSNPGVEAALPVEKDVIAYTKEGNPEIVAEEKLAAPAIKAAPKTPVPAPTPKPAPAPKPDALATTAPVAPTAPAPPTEATSPAPSNSTPAPAAAPVKPDHSDWNALLQKHVNAAGNVDYAAFKKEEAKLDAYLAELAAAPPGQDWTRPAAMAYWINAYNAATIKLILKNWPVKSIMDLHGGKPWDVKWINLGDATYSLNQIEHDIIRPRYQDPRIHFAVNCAAASCPPLPNQAFTAGNLNTLLNARTRSFIRNGAYNTITADKVAVSKIFDWYGEDFGDLRTYLNKYTATPIPAGQEIEYRDYDWSLNKQ